jgi:hypothetical protein
VLTIAGIARRRETNRAADVSGRAALAFHTTLTRRTAAAAANLATGTARAINAALAGIAANPVTAIVRTTVSALAAMVAGRHARSAYSVGADLGGGTAVRASVAGANATAVFPDTTNRRWARPTPIAALVTEAPVLGSVADALLSRRRPATKDSVTPILARILRRRRRLFPTEDTPNPAQTNEAAD